MHKLETRRFIQCDVFTPTPTRGNALAVVVDGADLSDETMRRFAHWLQAEGRLKGSVTVAQGTCIDRHGRVSIKPVDSHNVKIGGQTHILIEGTVLL